MSRHDDPGDPLPALVAIAALCPTQITVGMAEADTKRRRWRDVKDKGGFRAAVWSRCCSDGSRHRCVSNRASINAGSRAAERHDQQMPMPVVTDPK
jgi:hypothetical protein